MSTNPRKILKAVSGLVAGLLLSLLAFAASAQSTKPETIYIEPGTHKLLRSADGVGRVAVGNPLVADVNVINGRELLVIGIKSGVTSLLVWPRAGSRGSDAPKEYRVSVGALPSNDADLSRLNIQPNGVVSGTAPSLLAHSRAVQAAGPGEKGIVGDSSLVLGETQVTSQVRVVEVNRTTLQQYGINLFKVGSNSYGGIGSSGSINASPLSGAGSGLLAGLGSATGFLPIGDAFNIVFGNNGYSGVLSVLERKGLARVLAEPSLTALSGQTASFLAGGEFPYPVPQTNGSGGTGGTITVQFREFGVRLNLTPTVLSNSRIAIKVAPEVSDLDFTNGLSIAGTVVPGLIIRRTDTTVELGDGETFVLSGLISNNLTNNVDKVPWLGDIPVLGAFFRTTSINRAEKELIMVITPHLVRPLAKGTPLPPLPGEATDHYRPSAVETIFLENGDFGQAGDSGYSK